MNAVSPLRLKIFVWLVLIAPLRVFAAIDWAPLIGDWITDEPLVLVRLTAEQGLAVFPADKSAGFAAEGPASWQFDGAPVWEFETCSIESRIAEDRLTLVRIDKASKRKVTMVCRRPDAEKDAAILGLAKPLPPAPQPKPVQPPPASIPIPAASVPPAEAKPAEVVVVPKLPLSAEEQPKSTADQPERRTAAVPVAMVPPEYPREMLRARTTGSVLVDFVVTESGGVANATVVKSTHREFEAAAIAAVMQWKFKPARLNGAPVSTHLVVPVEFNLSDGRGGK